MPSSPRGPELFIGLVGAVGCDLPAVVESFRTSLLDVGYIAHDIRLSHLLHSLDAFADIENIHDQEQYINKHMDGGNSFRERTKRHDALATLAITKIRSIRQDKNDPAGGDDLPLDGTAYVFNSLKRPEEVATLRAIYGEAFLLVAAYAAREKRKDNLAARIARSQNVESQQSSPAAEELIERDEYERESPEGQDVRATFPLADVFIDATDKGAIDLSVRRFVSILFGHPFETPTRDEFGMQHAYSAALRSADLSRQVGYAACTQDGQILAVGTNEVAKGGGGSYWAEDIPDQRDFHFVASDEPNAEMKLAILKDLLHSLKENQVLPAETTISDEFVAVVAKKIRGSRLMAITEYGRAVHAEMAVVTDAARRGISLSGATLYGTTFPCHNCAKHIVASGIKRLVYIEPYPKSQVARLFSDSIAVERRPVGLQVVFQPFVGIAPPRFTDFFIMTDRKDRENGHILSWSNLKSTSKPRSSGDPKSYIPNEVRYVSMLVDAMSTAGIRFRGTGK